MNPRQFLRRYRPDERLATGAFFEDTRLTTSASGHIGVVLLGLGGPRLRSENETYLYARWMDPVRHAMLPKRGRHMVARCVAKVAARRLWREYEQVGGGCPSNRLIREQAASLEGFLNSTLGGDIGVRFSTYVSMRYGSPSPGDALRRILTDGVTRLILLPGHPQYSIDTTGTSLAYWSQMLAEEGTPLPTVAVVDYSTHPQYLQALADRVDQALQRFPRRVRRHVRILFCAEHGHEGGAAGPKDEFCDLAQRTVDGVSGLLGGRPERDLACFSAVASTGDESRRQITGILDSMSGSDAEAVLVVPLGHATDYLWTSYTLDIGFRQAAKERGIRYFEVTAGLNCHPLYIKCLTDLVRGRLSSVDQTGVAEPARGQTTGNSRSDESEDRSVGPTAGSGPGRLRESGSSQTHGVVAP